MNVLKGLLRSRKVWLAVVAAAQTILFSYIPDFPPAVWQAIDAVIVAVIGSIALEDAALKLGRERKPDVHILPAALEGPTHSMQQPPSVRAWTPPPPE